MATPITTFAKDSSSILDYGFDWSDWLPSGISLSCSIWSRNDVGINTSSIATTTSISTVWVSGGTRGITYSLTNVVWTSGNPQRKAERTLAIKIIDR